MDAHITLQEHTTMTNDRKEQPADTLRDGTLKATIWLNKGRKGAFYTTTFARSYQGHDGQWRDTSGFVGDDLLKLSELARAAYNRTRDLRRDDLQAQRNANQRRTPTEPPRQSQQHQDPRQSQQQPQQSSMPLPTPFHR